ncbi:MAG: FkbM family methyltransferase [Betaproteobacteria bacterium]
MFCSYAQNFEDVMLWRALSHVERGFYVDIGAQDPVVDSVSLAFYERGWRGVHVEPVAAYADMLREARPDEEVIEVAVGDRAGTLELHQIPATGLSTADAAIAARHAMLGYSVKPVSVPCVTLDTILTKYRKRAVHWLKVDVEGYEGRVLAGWSAQTPRPWIIVLESTAPLTQDDVSPAWEPLLTAKDYDFAYFDGVNRFYVAREQHKLKQSFSAPPNYFDNFSVGPLSWFARRSNEIMQSLRKQLGDSEDAFRLLQSETELFRAEAEDRHRVQAELLQGRSDEIALWTEDIARLQSENAAVEAALRTADERIGALEAEVQLRDGEFASLMTRHEEVLAALAEGAQVVRDLEDSLRTALAAAAAERERHASTIAAMADEARIDRELAEGKRVDLESRMLADRTRKEALHAALLDQLRAETGWSDQLALALSTAKATVAELESELVRVGRRLEQSESDVLARELEVRVAGQRLAEYTVRIAALEQAHADSEALGTQLRLSLDVAGGQLVEHRARIAALEQAHAESETRGAALGVRLAEVDATYLSLEHSLSWRITSPLRTMNRWRHRAAALAGKSNQDTPDV